MRASILTSPGVLRQVLGGKAPLLGALKISKLPPWFVPAALTAPELKTGGVLCVQAVGALVQILSMSDPDYRCEWIEQVKTAYTEQSLVDFAWDLFQMWRAHGSKAKDGWMLRALSWFGDEECASKLMPLMGQLSTGAGGLNPSTVIDILGEMGGDNTTFFLNCAARKTKMYGYDVWSRARDKIHTIAQLRGLSLDELADRTVPSLGLDASGGLDLNYGARHYRVELGESLLPFVLSSTGSQLRALPKPKTLDDKGQVWQARVKWTRLNEEASALLSSKIGHLEKMLVCARRITVATFLQFYANHPVMHKLASRLVWGVFDGNDPTRTPKETFRVCEDQSLAGVDDKPFNLRGTGCESPMVGLVHPIDFQGTTLALWQQIFADYKIAQPLEQLGRAIFALTEEEKQASVIKHFEGMRVNPVKVYPVFHKDWKDGSRYRDEITSLEKKMPLGCDLARVKLDFAKGFIDFRFHDSEEIVLGSLSFYMLLNGERIIALKFGLLSKREASEILRTVHRLASQS